MNVRSAVAAVAFALLGWAATPPALAQSPDTSSDSAAPSPAPSAPQFSDAELKSFASALAAMQQIRNAYAPRIAATDDADEQQQLTDAAVHEMEAAVLAQGISIEKFQSILVSARSDSALVDRVNSQLQRAR